VVDTLSALGRNRYASPGPTRHAGTLFVLDRAEPAYSGDIPGIETVHLDTLSMSDSCALIASRVLRSGNPVLFVHLGDEPLLRRLWELDVRTIPVVHNTEPGWPAPASVYNHPNVPFVVAVCEKAAQQLAGYGCLKRIVVVRHEIARPCTGTDQIETRRRVRARYGIRDDTLLVGMVGQFKRQKDYPKAVQVLAALGRRVPSKLMILGPWDHSWGDGRQVFAETYRTACELNVVADLISVGAVIEVDEYYDAFDVLLSTSTHEGLSISMMEASGLGCPIVSSDVGGAVEIASNGITLLSRDSTPDDYADAIMVAARTVIDTSAGSASAGNTSTGNAWGNRSAGNASAGTTWGNRSAGNTSAGNASVLPEQLELIPQLWNMLGQFADPFTRRPDLKSSVCLLDRLEPDGHQWNVVQRLASSGRIQYVLALGGVDADCEQRLRSRGVHIFDVSADQSLAEAAEEVMRTIQEIGASALYIVDVDCKLRLLLAKVLPPEGVAMYDADSPDALFQRLAGARNFQRRIAFDESAYFRRISPW
ncbi:MAG TPA: glycosyltransferase family 4 protein, partial [Blastocatellia bacterium]|nr:glycosyltransferase family 4 protein [Blastocatellia bacterium]